jgi:hypothetical protein
LDVELLRATVDLISQSEQAGSDEENWLRAEHELLEEQELQKR